MNILQKFLKKQILTRLPAIKFCMQRILPVLVLLLHLIGYAQIDPAKLDSLSRSINLSAKAHKHWQDSFTKAQDSIYHAAVNRNSGDKAHKPDKSSSEQEAQSSKQRQEGIVRIAIGVLVFAIGIIALMRRRNRKT